MRPQMLFLLPSQQHHSSERVRSTTAITELGLELFFCIAVVLHFCRVLQYNAAIQFFYNLQKTCRLLAAVVKNLYCSCIALVRTAAIQQNFLCYFIVVVLHLCGALNHKYRELAASAAVVECNR